MTFLLSSKFSTGRYVDLQYKWVSVCLSLDFIKINFSWSVLFPVLLSHFSRVQLCATPYTAAHQAPCPWDSPGKNNGVGFHFLLQCMKVKSQSKTKSSPLVNLLQADAPELCRIADSRKTEENQKPRNLPPSAEFPYLLVKSLWWPFHKCAN